MAIIRRKRFSDGGQPQSTDIDLIDTPDKLRAYAAKNSIAACPLDVEAVAKSLGIHLQYSPLQNDLSGILRMNPDDGQWQMIVNASHHPKRQRYTIAHELGHFCLHRYGVKTFEDKIFFRATPSNQMEWEANEFAANILMPEDEFRAFVRDGITSVDELANEFSVSSLALRIRAKELGFSGHGL